jgi:hypothetical protein
MTQIFLEGVPVLADTCSVLWSGIVFCGKGAFLTRDTAGFVDRDPDDFI